MDVLRFEDSWSLMGEEAYRVRFTEIVLVQAGRAVMEIDDQRFDVRARTVLLSPPGAVRRVRDARGLRGLVLLAADELPAEFLNDPSALSRLAGFTDGRPRAVPVDPAAFRRLVRSLADLRVELLATRADGPSVAHAMAWPLLLQVDRILRSAQLPAGSRGARELVRRFQALVTAECARSHRVDHYCRQLHVSRKHLAAVCARELRMTPREIIVRRALLEAKRMLAFTMMTNEQIASAVGFADGAHFARVFRRREGRSPRAFRNAR